MIKNFYPRPPRGGRRRPTTRLHWAVRFLSTPSARRATHEPKYEYKVTDISIHALREEGDADSGSDRTGRPISIHALREEGDLVGALERVYGGISIHALREEGDQGNTAALSVTTIFLSTPSARRATYSMDGAKRRRDISIHALREEGDVTQHTSAAWPTYFYPRPPRGGRPLASFSSSFWIYFYPRPPRGGRQAPPSKNGQTGGYFYPRPPRGGRPLRCSCGHAGKAHFYPRPPRGGRRHEH